MRWLQEGSTGLDWGQRTVVGTRTAGQAHQWCSGTTSAGVCTAYSGAWAQGPGGSCKQPPLTDMTAYTHMLDLSTLCLFGGWEVDYYPVFFCANA